MALPGWDNDKKLVLTIDSSNVDGELTNFPVLVTLSSSTGQTGFDATRVFDELTASGTDRRKIAITDSNDNQLYTEIERWDYENKEANLWVKIPIIASGADTALSLYYDSTHDDNIHFVGGVGDLSYQMIVDLGAEGTYDTNHMARPSVIKESDTSYKMWYSGHDTINWRILYADSTDGINWSNHQMIIDIDVEGTNDKTGAMYPFVIKESDISYKMWYGCQDVSNTLRIMYATSTNGISWSNHQMVLNINQELTYDTSLINAPYVIKESDTSYKMWYAGYDGTNWRTLYATSTDGIAWTGHQMVIDIGAQGTYDTSRVSVGSVIKESDTSYKMWYGGHDGTNQRIIYTTSTNGTTWSNHQLVINFGVEGTYDALSSSLPYIIEESDSSYKMWYSGQDGSNKWRIFYSTYWSTNVWDGNFRAVYHMNQDPSGGSGAIKDSTPNVHHGTSGGSMTSGDLVDGKIGKAIDFDGDNDFINVGNVLDVTTGSITLEGILKTSAATTQALFQKAYDIDVTKPGYSIYLRTSNPYVRMVASDGVDAAFQAVSPTNIQDGVFHHIVGIWDSSSHAVSSYVDSSLEGSTTNVDIDSLTNAENFEIGRNQNAGFPEIYLYGILGEARISNTARSASWIKATYYSNWNDFVTFSEPVLFIFSNPIPTDLSTVYGITQQLYLTTTVSGTAPSYTYDAVFYDAYDDSQISSTVYGTQSGQPAGVIMSTPSGINYQWYVTATSSGVEGTSSTYTFSNKFLYDGYVTQESVPVNRVVRLYHRDTGELVGSTTSSGVGGYYYLDTTISEEHFIVVFDDDLGDNYNALILDKLLPEV